VRKALGTLPWVEKDSVQIDFDAHQATMRVKPGRPFNMDEVVAVLAKNGFTKVRLVQGPD
jgi:hypothetical protein